MATQWSWLGPGDENLERDGKSTGWVAKFPVNVRSRHTVASGFGCSNETTKFQSLGTGIGFYHRRIHAIANARVQQNALLYL
ncbi:hypothetical protein V6N12_074255 [Hibiscus sabdariffa]